MAADITALLNLTLEIEGLLSLAATRAEATPPEVYNLLGIKARALANEVGDLTRPGSIPQQPDQSAPTPAQPYQPVTVPVFETAPAVEPAPEQVPEPIHDPIPAPAPAPHTSQPEQARTLQLTLNDKFRVMREVFGGNESEMNDALRVLSTFTTDEEITDYLANDLCLDTTDPEVQHLIGLVTGSL